MADRRKQPPSQRWARLLTRGERNGNGQSTDDVDRELLPGIVVRDGRIAASPRAKDPNTWMELGRFLLDVARLLYEVVRDPRVPLRGKVVAGAAAAYVVSPIDLVPDFVPTAGHIDDVYLVARSLRYLADAAGYELLRELWGGTDEGFALLMGLVSGE